MSNEIKELRKQLRPLVKEHLPDVMSNELYLKLQEQVRAGLKDIEATVKKNLKEIQDRHKDTMSYLVRTATVPSITPELKDGK